MSFRAQSDAAGPADQMPTPAGPDDQARALRALAGEVRRLAALAAVEHVRQLIAREERCDGVQVGGRLGAVLGGAPARIAHDGEGAA